MLRWTLLASLAVLPAQAATLEVVIGNVRTASGTVRASVCTAETFLADSCAVNGRVKARVGEVVVTFPNLPPGTYAVQAHLDEDDDNRIGRNFFGIPREGLGFSNDAPFRFGPPSFNDAAVSLGPAGGRIRFSLRYFD